MFENLDKIKSVITNIFTQISLNKLSNCHDLNVLAENVFMYVLNDCFDYHLQNANILNNVPNQVGFDLIDTKNKIIFQVTSSDTIEKYSETINHLTPCREVGTLKQYLKDAVLDNKVANEREPLMELLMKKAQEMGLVNAENSK